MGFLSDLVGAMLNGLPENETKETKNNMVNNFFGEIVFECGFKASEVHSKVLTIEDFKKVAMDNDPQCIELLLQNENVPGEILDFLFEQGGSKWGAGRHYGYLFATHSNLPTTVMTKMINYYRGYKDDKKESRIIDGRIIEYLAGNTNADESVLELMLNGDKIPEMVYLAIAARRDPLSDTVIDKLCESENSDVQFELSKRQDLTEKAINILMTSDKKVILDNLCFLDNVPDEFKKSRGW